jgi:2-oxoglutarate/2-oxoacid ferredoxin oxidoreductase subunit alpha|tara:strand:- start:17250 stop:19094 length:1845 start_codon:yes stop_codon:yes gene_type:complete
MNKTLEQKKEVTILFAGDSGDGIQLTGNQFSDTTALFGNDVRTFPDFPAEIRAPQGTVAGVSGFQLQFGSSDLYSPGDKADVLVVMNSAALKANLHNLKSSGIVIANSAGFDKKNLKLSGYGDENPLHTISEKEFRIHEIDITKLTRTALVDSGLGTKEVDRSKNMFVLGFLYWMYNRSLATTESFIKSKFKTKKHLIDANIKVLKAGYHFGDTSETFTSRYDVKPADLPKGNYRSIMGNQATALGLVAASQKSGLELLYASYPITPASDILHELAKHKNFGVKTFQAEDEIAAACAAVGASFAGNLAITASSGPGIALKGETIGLSVILELPLVIINVQRGGPSTGLPTKTEQSDLLQALYGRNGEAQTVVIAAKSPSDCFDKAYQACKIAVEHMTPVMLLTDGYMANGSEPWAFPKSADLPEIINHKTDKINSDKGYLPYLRDENLVRSWAVPGTKDLQHRVGGLEKDFLTGNVSYDPDNHEKMVKVRAAKIAKISDFIAEIELEAGTIDADVLVLGWGSTFGAIKTAVKDLSEEGYKVAHAHLTFINPMPRNLGAMLKSFKKVLIPELNDAQMVHVIRSKYLIDAIPFNKIKGLPFSIEEIKAKILETLPS